MTVKVLFICLGNICRSPMAEAIFRDGVTRRGLTRHFEIDSAGTGSWHMGEPPHPGTQDILRQKGISFEGQQSRQVEAGDLEYYDYLVVMDSQNMYDMQQLAPGDGRDNGDVRGQLVRLLDFADPEIVRGRTDVPDPYFTGGFSAVYTLIQSGCKGLLDHIVAGHEL